MRSEKAIMPSRREFLADALGTAFVKGLPSPISADQARSRQGQSNTSTSKAGRTARKTSLSWDVLVTPGIPAVTSDLAPGQAYRRRRHDARSGTNWRAVGVDNTGNQAYIQS